MRQALTVLLTAGVVLAPCGATFAQNVQPEPPGVPTPRVAPPSAPTPPPEKVAPGALKKHTAHHDKSLSDKLSDQNGTLKPPPGVDTGMTVKPPAHGAGQMPVIPPPGTPGGNQHVVPK